MSSKSDAHDDIGNRTYMQRHHKTGQPADVYRYDGLYQLVDAWYGADATTPANITTSDLYQTYDLDTLGNRLVVENDSAGQSYGPQAGGQLTNPMNRYETVDAATLAYDARGNTLDDGINTYAYDVLNRQTVLTNTAAITTEYIYDARGRRVAKVTAGITITHYLYDIQYRVLEERDGNGNWMARYTCGAGIDERLIMEVMAQEILTYYYHRDALGAPKNEQSPVHILIVDDEPDHLNLMINLLWFTRSETARCLTTYQSLSKEGTLSTA